MRLEDRGINADWSSIGESVLYPFQFTPNDLNNDGNLWVYAILIWKV